MSTNVHASKTENYDEKHKEIVAREKAAETLKDIRQGNLPENEQLLKGVDRLQDEMHKAEPKLSTTGKLAAKDVHNMLETAREIITEKNEDQHLQKAFKHAHQAGNGKSYTERIRQLRGTLTGTDKNQITTEARSGVQSLFTIVKLAFLSPEFRNTTNEFFQFFSDVLGKQSQKAESKHSAGPVAGSQHSSSSSAGQSDDVEIQDYPEPKADYQWSETNGVYSLKRVTEKKREKGASGLTKENEEKLIDRMVDLLQTFHKYPEYQNSIEYLSGAFKRMGDAATGKKEELKTAKAQDAVKSHPDNKYHQEQSKAEMMAFLENWIGDDYSLEDLKQSLIRFRAIVNNDQELKKLFRDLKTFFTKSAKDSNYVNDREKVRHDAKDLIERTNFFLNDKYRNEFRTLRGELRYLNKAIQRDQTVDKIRNDMSSLVNHLLMDSNGNPAFKPELFSDAQVLLQVIFSTIKYIPLPRIHKDTPNGGSFDLDNVVINTKDITPSQIHLGATVDAENINSNCLQVRISKIHAHIRKAKFSIDKRNGFPKFKESGFVDVDLTGVNGMNIYLELVPEKQDIHSNQPVHSLFKVRNATCSINKLKMRLTDTKHDGLYKFLGPVINMMAKKRIETMVRDQLVTAIEKINVQGARATNKAVDKGSEAKEKAKQKAPTEENNLKRQAEKHEKKAKKIQDKNEAEIKKDLEHGAHTTHTTHTTGTPHATGTVDKTPITSAGSAHTAHSAESTHAAHSAGSAHAAPATSHATGSIDTTPITH